MTVLVTVQQQPVVYVQDGTPGTTLVPLITELHELPLIMETGAQPLGSEVSTPGMRIIVQARALTTVVV